MAVQITQISAVNSGGNFDTIYGLGSDSKLYFWDKTSQGWKEHK